MAKKQTTDGDAKTDGGHLVGSASELVERARAAYDNGDPAGADNILRQLLAQLPDCAPAWHLQGIIAANAEAKDRAAACFAKAATLSPDTAAYCAALGESLDRLHRPGDAAAAWAQAVRSAPTEPGYRSRLAQSFVAAGALEDAHRQHEIMLRTHAGDTARRLHFAFALMRARHHRLAAAELDSILERTPGHAETRLALATCLHRLGTLDRAIEHYRAALETYPERLDTWSSLAAALRETGDAAEALRVADSVLARQLDHSPALNNRALALCDLGRHAEALESLEQASANDPANIEIRHNLAVTLHAAGRPDDSECMLRTIVETCPDGPESWRSLGNLLRETERFGEAEACYRRVLDLRPLDFKTYGSLGLALLNQDKADAAAAVYEKALALQPDHPDIRMSLGIAQLLAGDYRMGWRNYEARWETSGIADAQPSPDLPPWDGSADGKILVHAEQGFGDTLQFCRYVPIVAGAGNPVVFECQPPLLTLLRASFADLPEDRVTVIARGDPRPPADAHAPLLSLPRLLGTELSTVPADVPYLAADPRATARWRQRFGADKPAIALVWAGNPERQDDRMRSCPAAALAPITAIPGAGFYSLQKDATDATPDGMTDLAPHLNDFADTAAAIAALDLVITVDTAAAHLAGGLGKPVWVLLGRGADWRYLTGREDSPWYPTMRLYRRMNEMGWQALCERVARHLNRLISDGRPWQDRP
jgi:tetratricopeptide (TPR) repeat protein